MKWYLFILLFAPGIAMAHGGSLDKNGGHKNSATGSYHCHHTHCLVPNQNASHAVQRVEQRVNSNAYNRDNWKHWSDFDDNCMNTRHEILKAQADGRVVLSNNRCWVVSSIWYDPFSGTTLFKASDLDVDHIIPLKWAYDHGGASWSLQKKELFANDPDNLLAVDDGLNQAKGARGPSEWLPPNQTFRCQYLSLWQQGLAKYPSLKMNARENRVFQKQIAACRH
jgi:hypothetical protein